jgi:hypothetical protein
MPTVTLDQARKMMAAEVEQFATDELLEVHNEVFPDRPFTLAEAEKDRTPLIDRLVAHINSRLEIDQLVELFKLIFIIKHRNVWFNEEEDLLYFNEGLEYSEVE